MDGANASGTDFAVAVPRLTRLAPMIVGFLLFALRVTAGEVLILAVTEGILTAIAVLLVQYSKRWLAFATALAGSRFSDARITLFSVPEYSVKRPYRLPIGENPMGLPFYVDLTEGSILVAGVTGFGKSNLLRTLVRSALESSCSDLRLIDLKGGLELSKFCAHPKVRPFATDVSMARKTLASFKLIAEARFDVLRGENRRDWLETPYGRLTVLVIDELAELTVDKEAAILLDWIVNRGRAAGIVTVAATQQSTVDVLRSNSRQGFPTRAALHCATDDQARATFGTLPDHPRFNSKVLPRGHAIVYTRGAFHRVAVSRAL